MLGIETLKLERESLSRQLQAVDSLLETMGNAQVGAVHPNGSNGQQRKKRVWTNAQRKKMAAIQKKRWRELRAKQKAGA